MDALQASFMLLPAFTFLPDGDIQLGTVLPRVKTTDLPNARQPLPVRIDVKGEKIQRFDHGIWHWESDKSFDLSGGVWADVSVISGVGAGVDAGRSNSNALVIDSKSVKQETFVPTEEDIAVVKSNDLVSKILKRLECVPVYIVTGRMIADGADISRKSNQHSSSGAHVSADATSTGVPINAGVKGEIKQAENTSLVQAPKGQFILAYQLLRLRKRMLGKTVREEPETKWALFSDDKIAESDELHDLEAEVLGPHHFETAE